MDLTLKKRPSENVQLPAEFRPKTARILSRASKSAICCHDFALTDVKKSEKLTIVEPIEIPAGVRTRRSCESRHVLNVPVEVIAKILLNLDVRDLMKSCRLVCKTFNTIIMSDYFNRWKLAREFGPEMYAKVLATGLNPHRVLRYFNRNFYQGMYRWGHFDKPYIVRLKRNHVCSENAMASFRTLVSSPLIRQPLMSWVDEPPCYCVFGRSVTCSKIRMHSEVYGWCKVDLRASGVPNEILDIIRPPIAVGLWDPHPEARIGFHPGMKTRLVSESDETLTQGECLMIVGNNDRQSVFQQYVFTNYPAGVRKIIFYGPNSFLVQKSNSSPNFCGATVKLLTGPVYAECPPNE